MLIRYNLWRVNEWDAKLKKRYYYTTTYLRRYKIGSVGRYGGTVVGLMPICSELDLEEHGC